MTLTDAAQAVQRSAYPDAYAKHDPAATALFNAVSGRTALDCSAVMAGTAEPAPRKPDGSWPDEGCTIRPDPTTGNGCVTPRLLHLVQPCHPLSAASHGLILRPGSMTSTSR